MLPLAGDQQPTNATELAASLQSGLAQQGVVASVKADGTWPELSSLVIQLSRVARPKPLPRATADSAFTIAEFNINGTPVDIEGVAATVHARFSELGCGFGRAGDGPWQLVVRSAGSGHLEIEA